MSHDDTIIRMLQHMERHLQSLETKTGLIMATLDEVKAAVAETAGVEASAVALIQGLIEQVKAAVAANDPAALDALVQQLHDATAPLAAAVAANTPAPPAV